MTGPWTPSLALTNMKTQIKVDLSVYPLDCVYAAAYTFSKDAFVKLGKEGSGSLVVGLEAKNEKLRDERKLLGEFHNELLHHALRLKVASVNQVLRERIVLQALVSAQPKTAELPGAAPVLDAELEKEIEKLLKEAENETYKDDPLGIAVPWEKSKHAKKAKRKN
ncbi:MAG: His-Xaa-Ser system protein HxsD [Elusimicrobia bacterium GWA2_56_46]|jgi:His-Xaa-Ser system protein HxsD|nr:MAG: His-Xaa-Ser system protein HxsD [Elusimicrobia bacterium GWA2_56_46]OGR55835.1 MAG: His-Xaa-Ser system protein HxsD [Elusimicrobia bacterium GWC2_56_31]HBB65821.1 His-Xaa-Ser system protein HxsD [Elusimicrobiota bacterium]HBW22233.1 His-Xaa-Ser system protein HxsD [Elusimicrobiota bacterium]